MKCFSCGEKLADTVRYCSNCGTNLRGVAVRPTTEIKTEVVTDRDPEIETEAKTSFKSLPFESFITENFNEEMPVSYKYDVQDRLREALEDAKNSKLLSNEGYNALHQIVVSPRLHKYGDLAFLFKRLHTHYPIMRPTVNMLVEVLFRVHLPWVPYVQEAQANTKTEARKIPLNEQITQMLQEAERRCRNNRLDSAMKLCDQALALHKNHSEIYFRKGEILERSQRYQEALEAYDRAIRIGNMPTSGFNVKAKALHYKARVLSYLKCNEEALSALEESRRLDPTDMSILHTKSNVLTFLGRYDEAKIAGNAFKKWMDDRFAEAERRRNSG